MALPLHPSVGATSPLGVRQLYTWYLPAHVSAAGVSTHNIAAIVATAPMRPGSANVDVAIEPLILDIVRFLSDWTGGRAALDMHVADTLPITPLSICRHGVYLETTMLGKRRLRLNKIDECSAQFDPTDPDGSLCGALCQLAHALPRPPSRSLECSETLTEQHHRTRSPGKQAIHVIAPPSGEAYILPGRVKRTIGMVDPAATQESNPPCNPIKRPS